MLENSMWQSYMHLILDVGEACNPRISRSFHSAVVDGQSFNAPNQLSFASVMTFIGEMRNMEMLLHSDR